MKIGKLPKGVRTLIEEMKETVGSRGVVAPTGRGYAGKKPEGVYETMSIPGGLSNNEETFGYEIVDHGMDGKVYISVTVKPGQRENVKRRLSYLLMGPAERQPTGPTDGKSAVDSITTKVDELRTYADIVLRARKGGIRHVDGTYPEGVNVCRMDKGGVGVMVVQKGYGMPVYLHTYPGKSERLEELLRPQGR